MSRALLVAIAVYVPHLLEEHLTGMVGDPILGPFLSLLDGLPARAAGYAVFQAMLVTTLTTTYLYGLGGGARRAVMTVIGLGLLGEAHHLLRAAMTLHANSGVWTAAPMPIVGAWILFSIARAPRGSTLSPALS